MFGLEEKAVEVATSGQHSYTQFKDHGEVFLTIIQPTMSLESKTGGEGGVSVFEAKGNVKVDRTRNATYGEPIILFNPNNKAGLQLQGALSQSRDVLHRATAQGYRTTVDVDKLSDDRVVPVQEEDRVSIGALTSVQINKDRSISVINKPNVDNTDAGILNSFLASLIIVSKGTEKTYRANIMLLEPQDNLLKIIAHYNMDGADMYDKDIRLYSTQGCAGHALTNDKLRTFDRTEEGHEELGVPPDQARKIWRRLNSIISMPIRSSDANRLGVFNIDSDRLIEETKFRDRVFQDSMGLAAVAFGRFLERKI